MNRTILLSLSISSLLLSAAARADVELIAVGTISGTYEDLAFDTAPPLENGVASNRFGGIGSGFAWAGGTTFLGLPDRGPNADAYNPNVDDTVSFIDRFHTLTLSLAPSDEGSPLPFVLTPILRDTTLLSSAKPLVYGSGVGLGYQADGVTPLGSGAPALNRQNHTNYFTGRSDNFAPGSLSTNPNNARLDPEAIRVSRDGRSVFISDEYGPYLYRFDRFTGKRTRVYQLPDNLAIPYVSPQKSEEIANNTVGRVTNKGMEGLAITPDGRTLVGIMQANLQQDAKGSLRIVTIDVDSGETHEYAYELTDGSGASEIIAVNNHEFLVDERKGNGMADAPGLDEEASPAKVKKLYRIDLNGAVELVGEEGDLSGKAVYKDPVPFLDLIAVLNNAGIDSRLIPSKIEGLAFGEDVAINGELRHTLFVANDNDFLGMIADPLKDPVSIDPSRGLVPNPNQFYVFAFSDEDLPGYVPQQIHDGSDRDRGDHGERDSDTDEHGRR